MFDLVYDVALEEERAALLAEAWERETAMERAAEEAERAATEDLLLGVLAEIDRMIIEGDY